MAHSLTQLGRLPGHYSSPLTGFLYPSQHHQNELDFREPEIEELGYGLYHP